MTTSHLRDSLGSGDDRGPASMRASARRLVAVALFAVACSGFEQDPILQLSASEALEQGRQLMELEKYSQARPYLIHAFEIAPNTIEGRESLLLAADAFYKAGGIGNLVKAQQRYVDFLNRFPTSEHAAYAQFQIGMSMSRRMEKPDRDQVLSIEALRSFEDTVRLYPTSEHAELARAEIERVQYHLARHELIVARFYVRFQRFGTSSAAIKRLEKLLEDYPRFPERDLALLSLCRAYNNSLVEAHATKAVEVCGQLKAEFPDSRYVKKMPKKLGGEPNGKVIDPENVDPVVPADSGL